MIRGVLGQLTGAEGLARAERSNIPTFVRKVSDFETREGWDSALTTVVSGTPVHVHFDVSEPALLKQLAKLTGGGFTNLPPDRATLVSKLSRSDASFEREGDGRGDGGIILQQENRGGHGAARVGHCIFSRACR